jgi:hypothetical protein
MNDPGEALEEIVSGLSRDHFLIEGARMPSDSLWLRNLYDSIEHGVKEYTFLPVAIDMKEVRSDTFFQVVVEQIQQAIEIRYPSLSYIFEDASCVKDIVDFVYIMDILNSTVAKVTVLANRPLRIILLLYNTENIDSFGQKFKDDLNNIFKEPFFRAVIVAEKFSRKWESHSPHWLEDFRNVRLM